MTVLLLAGTAEARRLSWMLSDGGLPVIASLAGSTREPQPLPLATRNGGFGGEAGFRHYLRETGIRAVVDATHPFATRITERTARVCQELGLPYLLLRRPGWVPETGDRWTLIEEEEQAAELIPKKATVFLATGRQTLHRFANLEGRRVICRQIDPPTEPFPFEGGEFLIGRPPFPEARERDLFVELGVDWLVVKNAGGVSSRTKLDAARSLSLPVAMIRRPSPPRGVTMTDTVEAAHSWVNSL